MLKKTNPQTKQNQHNPTIQRIIIESGMQVTNALVTIGPDKQLTPCIEYTGYATANSMHTEVCELVTCVPY